MHLNYLDAENELASTYILEELGVETGAGLSEGFLLIKRETWDANNRWLAEGAQEYCCEMGLGVVYKVSCGELYFDIRDSGDHWIRCHMREGDCIKLPKGIFHRAVFKNGVQAEYSVYMSFSKEEKGSSGLIARFSVPRDGWKTIERHSYRSLVCDLCSQFFVQGWVTGTGGSISIRFGNRIFMTPSGMIIQILRIIGFFIFFLRIN